VQASVDDWGEVVTR